MDNELQSFINDYYEQNMWITEKHIQMINEKISSGEISSVEQLKAAVEKNRESLDRSKRWFFSGMGNKSAIRHYYEFNNKIFPVGKECEIEIKGKYKYLRLAGKFKIVIIPFYEYDLKYNEEYQAFTAYVDAKDHKVKFTYTFDHEDCYSILLYYIDVNEERLLFVNDVYALDEDLYELDYFKADLHIHTNFSDGIECPELVAASAREHGMDIIAITDHNCFAGSVCARKRVKEMGLDMTVLLGEEYAFEYSPMHILAYGTEEPICRYYLGKCLAESDEVKKIIAEKTDLKCDPVVYACTQVLLGELRRMGGISVLAHPYWKPISPDGRRDTPESVFMELSKDRRFDGIELVSGSLPGEYGTANMQSAFGFGLMNYDFDLPVIGITDSHYYTNDPICGKHFTVIFSKSKDTADVLESIRLGRCVAVEMADGVPLCYGKHRYMKLTRFLINRYFPERDKKAMAEAVLAKEKYICT